MDGRDERWHVYIVECKDGEFYVGIAKDVKARVAAHNKGKACRYTKHRSPVKLRFKGKQETYNAARRREREIKGFSRTKKLALIKANEAQCRLKIKSALQSKKAKKDPSATS